MNQEFNFIPEEYISGQLDSKPEQSEGEYELL